MEKRFIITTNENTAKMLRSMGFTYLKGSKGTWVFLNSDTMFFSNLDDITYTNKMFI